MNKHRPWTPEEESWLLANAPKKNMQSLIHYLGRTHVAIQKRCRKMHTSIRDLRMSESDMCGVDVARALGVVPEAVFKWYKKGLLNARAIRVRKRRTLGFAATDVYDFLRNQGGAWIVHSPSAEWRDHVAEIRAELDRMHITMPELARLLHRAPPTMWNCQKRNPDFPRPAFRMGTFAGGYRYDRAELRAWLDLHPEYWTQTAKEEL